MKGSVDVQKAMPECIIFHVLKNRVIIKRAAKKFIFLAAPFLSGKCAVRRVPSQIRLADL